MKRDTSDTRRRKATRRDAKIRKLEAENARLRAENAELRARIGGDSRLIAEIKGPVDEVVSAVRGLEGVSELHSEQNNGWTRLTVTTQADLCEEIYKLSARKQWSIRELRREIASLEDYFVKIVAEGQ